MRKETTRSNLALTRAFCALTFIVTFSAASNTLAAGGVASFCEGTIEGAGGTTGIPNGRFFTIGVGSPSKQQIDSKNCLEETGTATEVIDGPCTIGGKLLDPCVITGDDTTIIALTTNCQVVALAEGSDQSTPGLAIIYATSGPLNGCASGAEVFPFNGKASGYSVGVSTVQQVPPAFVPGIGTCPVVGAGGLSTCVSNRQ